MSEDCDNTKVDIEGIIKPAPQDCPPTRNVNSQSKIVADQIQESENTIESCVLSDEKGTQLEKVSTINMSLEEAARLEVMRLNTGDRTPVSLMQELLSKRGTAPKYELIQIEGAVNEPIFKYRISLASECRLYVALGSGKSKKEAKHNAAKSVLDQLIGYDEKALSQKENLFKVEPNPVGQLQEASMMRKWPPPVYETEETTGLPHERMFTVCVYVNVYKEEGVGKSKKMAKREAALNMLQFLETVPMDIVEKKSEDESDDKGESGLKQTHDNTFLTPQILKKIQHYHTAFTQKSEGPFLEKLLSITNAEQQLEDPIEFFEDLVDELKYRISFVDIEEKSKEDTFQSLLQLTSTPVTLFCGSGISIEDAKLKAIYRALDFLQIMNR